MHMSASVSGTEQTFGREKQSIPLVLHPFPVVSLIHPSVSCSSVDSFMAVVTAGRVGVVGGELGGGASVN